MISEARAKQFDVILVHKFDRFARNDYDFIIIYEKELEDLGLIVQSISEPGDASTPAGYFGRRMMQVISACTPRTWPRRRRRASSGRWRPVAGLESPPGIRQPPR
jgi:DNA invertase Pin-like site-specific DNA recombinase